MVSIIKNTAEAIESSFGIPIELAMFIAISKHPFLNNLHYTSYGTSISNFI